MGKCSYCNSVLPEGRAAKNQPHKFRLILLEYHGGGIMKREYVACYNCRQKITWSLNEKTGALRTLNMPALPPSELAKFLNKSLGEEWNDNDIPRRVHLCNTCFVKCDYGKMKNHIYNCLAYKNAVLGEL